MRVTRDRMKVGDTAFITDGYNKFMSKVVDVSDTQITTTRWEDARGASKKERWLKSTGKLFGRPEINMTLMEQEAEHQKPKPKIPKTRRRKVRRGDIQIGRTYSNRNGTIHRKVIKTEIDASLQDSCVVYYEVTKGQSKRINGESGNCTMRSFASWAKCSVKETAP